MVVLSIRLGWDEAERKPVSRAGALAKRRLAYRQRIVPLIIPAEVLFKVPFKARSKLPEAAPNAPSAPRGLSHK
ncbi:hypothetical protein WJ0W_006248 [Paenibacillus melissococcoides]|uniref:Uncharacterized protein n=1 Tax=Paenibacillus melissococcoides TaxID=2912268 RepID=A0ABM9GCV3_9BACL|nr:MULTISPECIES: hypothetical protein [Paenibacillus]MEB9896469.1 hypothetical protein [Bacillus cereus]GIO82581.1 hypothetical protein J6TS7_61910 [Paenibacillus dendritiformis]CAH8249061.1 hypothetical protein WJ0W_006248 [Paenibacillus melissococcoides]